MKAINSLNLRTLCLLITVMIAGTSLSAQDPCASITTISNCGQGVSAAIAAGQGSWSLYLHGYNEVFGVNGKEKLYTYTPAVTGKYLLSVTTTDYNSAYYFFKPASSGCGMYSWIPIGNVYSGGVKYLIGTLQAGVPYYLLMDAYSDYAGANHEFEIVCAETYDPCSNIPVINCNDDVYVSLPAGAGAFDLPGCASYNNVPDLGKEAIYSFTPVLSGKIAVKVTATSGWEWVSYSIKNAADGCNGNNWTCLGGTSSVWNDYYSNTYDVIAGNTYYIMADAGTINGATGQTFQITCIDPYDPCQTISPIPCSTPVTATIPTGFGAYDTVGQYCHQYYSYFYNPGKELIYSFTATVNGIHRIEVSNTDYFGATYTIKETAGGCNAAGWQCIGAVAYPGSIYTSTPLTAGTEYYIMVDAETPSGAVHTFTVHCDPPYDPCQNISPISCGSVVNYTIPEGRGAMMTNLSNPYYIQLDGKEMIYEFTATISGTHLLNITSAAGASAWYLIKEASGGCNEFGWTLISSSGIPLPAYKAIPLTLTAGKTYYLMLETYYNNYPPGVSGEFSITCPAQAYEPCVNITNIPDCGVMMTTTHDNGIGYYACLPPTEGYDGPPAGRENIFSFTPSVTGKYNFMANDGTGTGKILYGIKEASGGCNGDGWQVIGTFYSNTGWTNYETLIRMVLQAGTTYYIMADPIDTNAISQTFSLICLPSVDPCLNITPLVCGDYYNYYFPDGAGKYDALCGGIFPGGSEMILSFTPQETGQYFIDGSSGPGVHVYYKEAATGCGTAGWNCMLTDQYGTLYSQTPVLTEGVEYYLMFQALNDWDGYGYLSIRMGCQANCTIYADADGDGYGDAALAFSFCGGPYPGYSSNNNDCNDGNASINPTATEICGNQVDDNCDGQVDEGCGCGMTVNAGNDESTYFGYSVDQTVTHTAVVSGGTAPFSYSWTMNRPLSCNQVNNSGDEIFMFGTCANTICPTAGQLVLNPVCTGSASVKVKLMDTTEVCVTVTDVNGCTATDCFVVNATDARCFAGNSNNQKVKVCHQTGNPNNPWVQICVDESAVANLVAQGDYVGNCVAVREMAALPELDLYPNPADNSVTLLFDSGDEANYELQVSDVTSRISYMVQGKAASGNNYLIIPTSNLKPGVYIIRLSLNGTQLIRKLQIAR